METVETEKILTAAEMFEIVGDELREKNAEIERLREALRQIANIENDPEFGLPPIGNAIKIAQDALEEE